MNVQTFLGLVIFKFLTAVRKVGLDWLVASSSLLFFFKFLNRGFGKIVKVKGQSAIIFMFFFRYKIVGYKA